MPMTLWPFIEFDTQGVPHVAGTRTKILEVVLDHLANGWDAEEIHREYPHLLLTHIHAALGYYYENQAECDRQIDEQLREVDEWRERFQNSALQTKLRLLKRGP